MTFSNIDLTLASSLSAYAFSLLAITNDHLVGSISTVSALIFCLTALIKFIDLAMEKWKKWTKDKK
jgi:hypothetical protein